MTRSIVHRLCAVVVGLFGVASASCSHVVGPRDVPRDQFNYNEAIARSAREQLLLNIVRLRYLEPVSFMEVTGVTTQYSWVRSASVSSAIGLDDGPFSETLGGSSTALLSESPIISYAPLSGADYAERLLTPIPPETLFLLSQSGWSVERLMLCCVERFGDMVNARSATGPTPTVLPDNQNFRQLADEFRQLQIDDDFVVDVTRGDPEHNRSASVQLNFRSEVAGAHEMEIAAFASRLNISFPTGPIVITSLAARANDDASNDLFVRGRTVLGILYALSHTVDVPAEHARFVEHSAPSLSGGAQNWEDGVLGGIFDIRTNPTPPREAFVAVQYRGHWFYIADDEFSHKSTFDLVGHLFALQASVGEGATPLLTIGAGG